MQVLSVGQLPNDFPACVLTIGNFDGVHLGHRELVRRVVDKSKKTKQQAAALTFDPHPMQVLHPGREFKRLFSNEDRASVMAGLGIQTLIVEPFSRELSSQTPEWFVKELVIGKVHAAFLYVGFDFSFGQNRSGTTDILKALCTQAGIGCEIVPPVKVDGEIVSSTKIRQAILGGNVELAQRYLGRSFYIAGLVEKGAGRGKKIGFPTANLYTQSQIFPKMGVYFTETTVLGTKYRSITNVGQNPTFENGTRHPIQVETHILDFNQDIYGESIQTHFLKFHRGEVKFPNVQALVAQITSDIRKARVFFKTTSGAEK